MNFVNTGCLLMSDRGVPIPVDEATLDRVSEAREWAAKKGRYVHEAGCGAGPDEPCTCESPYPRVKRKEGP